MGSLSAEQANIEGQINDIYRALLNEVEELTGKMYECKRLIEKFDREIKEEEVRNTPDTNKSMIKDLNSYVALKKQHANNVEKQVDLFGGPNGGEGFGEENVLRASSMTNQQLIDKGNQIMDETSQANMRSKKVVEDTIINVGEDITTPLLKAQREQQIWSKIDSDDVWHRNCFLLFLAIVLAMLLIGLWFNARLLSVLPDYSVALL